MTDKNPPDTNPADKTPAAKNPTASGPDDEAFVSDLRASFQADPTPQHRDGFWASLQDELDFEVSNRPEGVVEIQDVKVHEVDPTAWTPAGADELAPRRTRRSGRSSAKPLVGAAAAACLLLVMGGLWLSRTGDRDRTETVSSASQVPDGAAQRSNALLSPLITLPADMASTDLEPLFTVRSASKSVFYHRLTSLSELTADAMWTNKADFGPVPEALPGLSDEGFDRATYTLLGESVGPPWLLAPSGTTSVDVVGGGSLHFDPDGSSWLVDDEAEPIDEYTAVFTSPNAFVGPGVPELPGPSADPVNLELPDQIRSQVERLAASLTSDAESDFDRAGALEAFFRSEFTFDLDARSTTDKPMQEFLDRRTGDPERFAGTFAAMLRSLDVPARVAVGFLPGESVDGDPDLQIVRLRDAHAWAEVYVGGFWVRFDPTPGRGISTGSPDVPVMNRDHWHAPYAFYDCRSGTYLTESVSTLDPLGIHSHQDGVIHIHPFFDASAGKNATFGIFLDSIEATLDGSGLSSLEGSLPAAATCDGEEAVLHLRKWQFDFIIDSAEPEIVVDGIDSVRFENDREVYLLALAPIDGDLPPFPAERLEVLEAVAGGITAVPPAGD